MKSVILEYISAFRPQNYPSAVAFSMPFIFVAGFLYLRKNNLKFLYNKQMLAIAAVFFCCVLVSGQMWNHIKSPPFYRKTKDGPVYIKIVYRRQFVLESYIVAILNGAVAVGMILIIEANSEIVRTKAEGKLRWFQSVVGLVLVGVFVSLLLFLFSTKRQGYPYSHILSFLL